MSHPPLHVLFFHRNDEWVRQVSTRLWLGRWESRQVSSVPRMLEILESSVPAIIVLDPEVSSFKLESLLALLRCKAPFAQFILVSAPASDGLEEREWFGVDRHLWKPVVPEGLYLALVSALRTRPRASIISYREAPHIVCVDEGPQFLRTVDRMLSRHGYRVTCFGDLRCAQDALEALDPDLMILDLKSPGMDGDLLAQAVQRRLSKKLPIVHLRQGHSISDPGEEEEGVFLTRLEKSCNSEAILAAVDRLIGRPQPVEAVVF